MSRIIEPSQIKYNDPYSQKLLQFESTDPKIYLSRTSNYILKAVGNDVILSGLEVTNISINSTTVSITLSPGTLIQDSTYIEIKEEITLSLDIDTYDSCYGYLILYTDYQYIESISPTNTIKLKFSYITNDGLLLVPIEDPWNYYKNRVYIGLFKFNKYPSLTVKEIKVPNYFYIDGRLYWRRGQANFLKSNDIDLQFFEKEHNEISFRIFAQLYDSSKKQYKLNNLQLIDNNHLRLCIDEYKPFDNYYTLNISETSDCISYLINPTDIVSSNYVYTLTHNLLQKYFLVCLYDNEYKKVLPKSIIFSSDSQLIIDFSNLKYNLSPNYHLVLVKDNIHVFDILESNFSSNPITIFHNLNKPFINTQLVRVSNSELINSNDNVFTIKDNYNLLLDSTICNITADNYKLIVHDNLIDPLFIYTNQSITFDSSIYVRKFYLSDLDVNNEIYITHNLDIEYPLVYLFLTTNNESFSIVFPDTVKLIDKNIIKLYFSYVDNLTTQYSVCVYSKNLVKYSFINSNINPVTSNLLLDLTGAGIVNPIFQIFDQYKQLVQPNSITKSSDTYTFNFSNNPTIDNFSIVVANSVENSYTETFSNLAPINNLYTVNHNLNTSYPIVQLYQNNNIIIIPNEIIVLNTNSVQLDLSYIDLSISSTFTVNVITSIARLAQVYAYPNCYVQEFSDIDINLNILTVNHGLNFLTPIIQIYNHNNVLIDMSTVTIQIQNKDRLTVNFTNYGTVTSYHKIVIMVPFGV